VKDVADRYAEALFEKTAGDKEFFQEMSTWRQTLKENPSWKAFLCGPTPYSKKEAAVKKVLQSANPFLVNFFLLLLRRGRINEYEKVCEFYEAKNEEKEGILSAQLTVASPSLMELKDKWEKEIHRFFGKKTVIKEKIDPSLIGGVIVQIGNKQIDYSVKRRLTDLKRTLSR
jgi:F-type H+-transporting ATPase subunit delta